MLKAIVQSHEQLSNFLSAFSQVFKNRPQYRLFKAYILGLILYLGSRNLAGLSRAIPDGKSACSLYRFVAKMDWDTEQVEQIRIEMLNRRTRRALQALGRHGKTVPVFLAIDDSLVEKTGKSINGVGYHYSHSENKMVWGHVWVTGQIIVLGQSYPVEWKIYLRQATCEEMDILFKSKPELAATILRNFKPLPKTQTYVLTDSWYPSKELLDLCVEQGFHLISAVKSNRKFKNTGRNLQVKQWCQNLSEQAFGHVTVNTTGYKVWSSNGCLSSGHSCKLVLNRVIGNKQWRFLICTDLSLSTQTIISYYLARWEVENFYRVAKQSLGWGDYQMRDLFAIERHVTLMMVSHAYLEIQRQEALADDPEPDAHVTLGDIQRQHQALYRRVEISQVFNLTRQGFELDSIFKQMAA